MLPGFVVDAVAEVPYGAHPTSFYPRYGYDTDLHLDWVAAARDEASAKEFLDRYIHAPASHTEYLDAVGGAATMIELVSLVRG